MLFFPSDYDLYLFHEGSLVRSYRVMGAHPVEHGREQGVVFTVWAPGAREVRVVGDFNNWQGHLNPMQCIKDTGVWTAFVPGAHEGQFYKYEIHTGWGEIFLKSDPYAFFSELRPGTASCIHSLEGYHWGDNDWQEAKKKRSTYNRPMNIYEVHLGSWKRRPGGEYYSYRELAGELVDYVAEMGYTHIELLPLAEHPFDGSWGYQATGYFSVTSRHGTPHDFMYFVDRCHQKGIGVIMDWVPGHFCKDAHGLRRFDGYPLYEHGDPRRGESAEWDTLNFDLGRPEVCSFLISNAIFWMDIYHVDGLRVDAVASMLYLDYGKSEGQWIPNKYGGRENLEAIDFIRQLNEQVFKYHPEALMVAEDSTEWPLVSAPTYAGGLGFNYKWNMGWMNDTLKYMQTDALYRQWQHNLLTFSFWYIFSENFILPLSHDEVVHGKKSLLGKMPGDYWQKFANLRLLYGYMAAHPGKKLLFMGGEIGQFDEWYHERGLGWNLLEYDMHRMLNNYVRELNWFYRNESCLWELDHRPEGFEWIDHRDSSKSIIIFMRKSSRQDDFAIIVCNFTPVLHENYRIGVPLSGAYKEAFNSDSEAFGGSGQENRDTMETSPQPWHNQPYSIAIKIPPLAVTIIKPHANEEGGQRR